METDHGMERMQQILSTYYGMQDIGNEEETQRNIDAQGFNAKIYVKEMLQTQNLNELLDQDNHLIQEIKELDTNMQMLVYENYNKFISATDTIRKMKTNVASMESEVSKVVSHMGVITERSESINLALAPHRSKVEKLIGIRRLLKRFEFIFELPQRLNTAVKQQDYATATKYFLLARQILQRYEHLASFKTIQIEADTIIKRLKRLLNDRLKDTSSTSAEICETMNLLIQLGAHSEEKQDQFLAWHKTYFINLLDTYSISVVNEQEKSSSTVLSILRELKSSFLNDFESVIRLYKDNFMQDNTHFDRETQDQISSSAASASIASMTFMSSPIAKFVQSIFDTYISIIKKQFQRPVIEFGTLDSLQLELEVPAVSSTNEWFILMHVLKEFFVNVQTLHQILPQCQLVKAAVDVIDACISYQMERNFIQLRQDTLSRLKEGYARRVAFPTEPIPIDSSQEAAIITEKVVATLRSLEPILLTGAKVLPEMSSLFTYSAQTHMHEYLNWWNDVVLLYTQPKRAFQSSDSNKHEILPAYAEPSVSYLLFLAYICKELANEGISTCLEVLLELSFAGDASNSSKTYSPLASRQGQNTRRLSFSGSSRNRSLSFASNSSSSHRKDRFQEVSQMVSAIHETAQTLAEYVAKMYGTRMDVVLAAGIENTPWFDLTSPPRTVQDMVVNVIEQTLKYSRELALMLGVEDPFKNSLPYTDSGRNSNVHQLNRDFRRQLDSLSATAGVNHAKLLPSRGRDVTSENASAFAVNAEFDVERLFLAKNVPVFQTPKEYLSGNKSNNASTSGVTASVKSGSNAAHFHSASIDTSTGSGRTRTSSIEMQKTEWLSVSYFTYFMFKMAVKSTSEYVRDYEFSTSGLQQMQVNAEFWKVAMTTILSDQSPQVSELESMLTDLLTNTRDRAIIDELLDPAQIAAITSSVIATVFASQSQ